MIRYRMSCDTGQLGEVVAMIQEAQNAGAPDEAYVAFDDGSGEFIIHWDGE